MDSRCHPNDSVEAFFKPSNVLLVATHPNTSHYKLHNSPPKLFVLYPLNNSGVLILPVHFEGYCHVHRTVGANSQKRMKAAACLNPFTPVPVLYDIMNDVNMVLVISVHT